MSKYTLLEKHSSSAPHVDDFIKKSQSLPKDSSPKDSSRCKTSIRTFRDRFSEGLFEMERIQAAVSELTEEWNLAESF